MIVTYTLGDNTTACMSNVVLLGAWCLTLLAQCFATGGVAPCLLVK